MQTIIDQQVAALQKLSKAELLEVLKQVIPNIYVVAFKSLDDRELDSTCFWGAYLDEDVAQAEVDEHLSEGLYDEDEITIGTCQLGFEHQVDPDLVE